MHRTTCAPGRIVSAALISGLTLISAGTALAERSYRITLGEDTYTVRRVPAESLGAALDISVAVLDPSPALRVGGAETSKRMLQVVESFCGMPAGWLKDYGAYGDPLWRDPKTGEWVIWMDCEPGAGTLD